jgi:cytochrome o ubiquinol oxidase subunit 3
MTAEIIRDSHHEADEKTIFGFWIYIMTDCVLFATLFATYVVLRHNSFGGPTEKDIFHLPYVLVETLVLLTSSFTCGLATLAAYKNQKKMLFLWMLSTFLLGACFLGLELFEFHGLVQEGASWQTSAFLSAFFTLVGTHGLHITAGLIWSIFLMAQHFFCGITTTALRRLVCFSLFWHFLDIVWIFIFTIVFLMGVS